MIVEHAPHSTTTSTSLVGIVNEPAIVISQPGTPTTARDPANITGVGQMIVNNGGGSIGLCTGTLINPRTVLFAAHCVNGRAATAYGSGSGGTAIGFGFNNANNTTQPGRPAGSSPLRDWFLAGPNQFLTDTANFFYTVNAITYNPLSLEPAARSFLYGDVAIATLDTPAANVPTWAILLSQLPQPTASGPAGTGYHVNITGYGVNGDGVTGATGGTDFRRRVAENWLGALTSLDRVNTFLFGSSAGTLPQNLYWLDFDDPRRGTAAASGFDFNIFRDNPLPNEGTTAGGDSGGPLILDRTYARQVVIGVLSGGSRYFGAQAFSTYGTSAFYQPLYLYWDWIAANNPYRYATTLAGDGNWTDPTRWLTTQDPNYFILGANGQLINGVPALVGEQNRGTSGQFGEVCVQGPAGGGANQCLNLRTGVTTTSTNPIGQGGEAVPISLLSNNLGSALVGDLAAEVGAPMASENIATNGGTQTSQNVPPATIANGLPGATNFVPNNTAGVRLTGVLPRYFDVTLSANGTTTLNTAVTIDRFRLNGAGARLDITSTGALTSLIDVTQTVGTLQINGSLTSVGDYFLMVGGINGTGTITTPFFTSALGVISPGAVGAAGSIGTLNFRGNVVLASGNTYNVDLGANGASDRIAVARTTATNGIANVGGNLLLNFSADTLRSGNVYTILTAENGITGAFQTPAAISAILQPTLITGTNQIQLAINPGLYRNVVQSSSPVQSSYAALLDQNRQSAASYDSIYGPLDLQSAATIQSTLEGIAPRTETLRSSMGLAVTANAARIVQDRLAEIDPGNAGGSLAYVGRPIQTAQMMAMPGLVATASDAASTDTTMVRENALPDMMNGFIAGGYLNGSSAPMVTAVPAGGRDRFDGFYIAGGIEAAIADASTIGFALSYIKIIGQTSFAGQSGDAGLIQGTLYGKTGIGNWTLDAQLGAGVLSSTMLRTATIVGTNFSLRSKDDSLAVTSEVGLSRLWGSSIKFGPRIAMRASHIGFSRIAENGGGPALAIDRNSFNSVQGRIGLMLKGGANIRPYASATYVHDFVARPSDFGATFVGGVGLAAFALNRQDRDWFELSAGLAVDAGNATLSIGADTTVDREDVRQQSYRAAIKVRF